MSEPFQVAPAGSGEYAPPVRRGGGLRTRWLLFVPLIAFAAAAVIFYFLLGRDVHLVPSPLIGKPVPQFNLPPVQGRRLGLSSEDLVGHVSLVNVFASWCVACRAEHPLLMQLHRSGAVALYGLDYKDPPDDAAKWLDTMGDPYARTGADINGRVAIDWGVYGVPETFVVDAQKRIAYKQIGPVTQEILDTVIMPLVAKLGAEPSGHAQ